MNKLFDRIHDNLITGRRMDEADIKKNFEIPGQTLQNWKEGKKGEGKQKLYVLLRLVDAEMLEYILKSGPNGEEKKRKP